MQNKKYRESKGFGESENILTILSLSISSKGFFFRPGHNLKVNFIKLQQAYEDSILSMTQIFWWLKTCSKGRKSIEDESRKKGPQLKVQMKMSIRIIGEKLSFTHVIVHQILLNKLGMRKIWAKMVPKTLSQD